LEAVRQLGLLGSTGSIGISTLEVVRHHPDRLKIATLAAFGNNLDRLEEQIEEFRPSHGVEGPAVWHGDCLLHFTIRVSAHHRWATWP
jgi:1-deoxy-D-xylulose-5-phosphate reductoisomerase